MVTALGALCVVLAVAVLALCVEVWALPRRRHRVLVNLLGDEGTIEGLLWSRRGCWLVIKDARLLRMNGTVVDIDGEAVIDKSRVAFLQVP